MRPLSFRLISEQHQHSALLFRNANVTPEAQYALTKAFDPSAESYGHGNNKTGSERKSILHPDLKTIPRVPQVQLIGNGKVYNHEGLPEVKLFINPVGLPIHSRLRLGHRLS